MSKMGPEYADSKQKRLFDLIVAYSLSPSVMLANLAVRQLLNRSGGQHQSTLFTESRVGKGFEEFAFSKFRTINPETKLSYGLWADKLAKLGLDEYPQISSIKSGKMSVFGRRPLPTGYTDEILLVLPKRLRKPWSNIVELRKPGIVSSYALYHHLHPNQDPNEHEIRAEFDIMDERLDSFSYETQMIGTMVMASLNRDFKEVAITS